MMEYVWLLLPWILLALCFSNRNKWRRKAGEAYFYAARFAKDNAVKNIMSRKAVAAGNKKTTDMYALGYPDRFSKGNALTVFKRCGIPCAFSNYYYPSRFTPIMSDEQIKSNNYILNFKDGEESGIEFFENGLKLLNPPPGTVIMFMPCSDWVKYEQRFKRLSGYIFSKHKELESGLRYLEITDVRTSLHTQKNRSEVELKKNYILTKDLEGKKVIIVDDIISSGKSMKAFCNQIRLAGGDVIGAIFAGQTIETPSNTEAFIDAWTTELNPKEWEQELIDHLTKWDKPGKKSARNEEFRVLSVTTQQIRIETSDSLVRKVDLSKVQAGESIDYRNRIDRI